MIRFAGLVGAENPPGTSHALSGEDFSVGSSEKMTKMKLSKVVLPKSLLQSVDLKPLAPAAVALNELKSSATSPRRVNCVNEIFADLDFEHAASPDNFTETLTPKYFFDEYGADHRADDNLQRQLSCSGIEKQPCILQELVLNASLTATPAIVGLEVDSALVPKSKVAQAPSRVQRIRRTRRIKTTNVRQMLESGFNI